MKTLTAYVTRYQLEEGSPWLTGIRVSANYGEVDTIIAMDGTVIADVWDLQEAHHEGSFVVRTDNTVETSRVIG